MAPSKTNTDQNNESNIFSVIFLKLGPWVLSVLLAWFAWEARELKQIVYTGQTRIVILETRIDQMAKDQTKLETKIDSHIEAWQAANLKK